MAKPYVMSGLVEEILPLQTFKSGFTKRTMVIVDDPDAEYPRYCSFDFIKDQAAALDGLGQGERVSVSFYAESRVWENPGNGERRWFPSLRGVKVESRGGAAKTSAPPAPMAASAPGLEIRTDPAVDPENLPF